MILVVDNYDSFTWNLVQAVGTLRPGAEVHVVRNDRIDAAAAEALGPSHLIISPGPCTPVEAGASVEIIRRLAGRVRILGVCLGHQCIAAAFGMIVRPHLRPMHGKASIVHHDGRGLFAAVSSPLVAARYHSLIVDERSIPRGWEVSAWTEEPDGARVVMGIRRVWSEPGVSPRQVTSARRATASLPIPHRAVESSAPSGPPRVHRSTREKPLIEGVQFHPESFLTPDGPRLLANFLQDGGSDAAATPPPARSTLRA